MADERKDDQIAQDDPILAEALARRDESRAQVFRGRANRLDANEAAAAYRGMADKAAAEAKKSTAALDDIEPPQPDPEGTSRQLADSEGNFAANAEVAAVGGIGIKGSNSVEGTDQPAATAEEAGTPIVEGAQKIVGDQPVEPKGKRNK